MLHMFFLNITDLPSRPAIVRPGIHGNESIFYWNLNDANWEGNISEVLSIDMASQSASRVGRCEV